MDKADLIKKLKLRIPNRSRRRFILYMCGGCKSISHLLYSTASVNAINIAEKIADSGVADDVFRASAWAAESATFGYDLCPDRLDHYYGTNFRENPDFTRLIDIGLFTCVPDGTFRINHELRERVLWAARIAEACLTSPFPPEGRWYDFVRSVDWPSDWLYECVYGCEYEIFLLFSRWRTSAVLALAENIMANESVELLPILGDALQDVGCNEAAVLRHCYSGSQHVKGCWIIDGILGFQ